jgi:hypothetical protein
LVVGRVDVVLEQDGDAVEESAATVPQPTPVGLCRLLDRVRVDRDDRPDQGVDARDPVDVEASEAGGREATAAHGVLDVRDRRCLQIDAREDGRRRGGIGAER